MHSKKDVFEFPEDNQIVRTNLDDYNTELLNMNSSTAQSHSSLEDDPPNRVFLSSLLFFCSAAASLFLATFISRYSPLVGSSLSLVIVLIFQEWNRIYGDRLTQRIRASINYASILREHKDYIPSCNTYWFFGKMYKPYSFGCTGPSLNPDMDRTPDDPESRSPTRERTDEKLRKDG